MRTNSFRLMILFSAACALVATSDARAQEFKIENRVYDGKSAVGGSTTIFAARTYDFVEVPAETVIYDAATKRFTLLDGKRQTRCELTAEQVADFCQRVAERAKTSDSSYVQFMAKPDFTEEFNVDNKELVLNSAFMTYKAKTVAARDLESLSRYQDFTYRQAQLNTVLVPGSQPPAARLKLHAALAQRQVMAEEVTLKRATVIPNFSRPLRAEHKIAWTLDDADRKRVADADQQAATFTPLPIAEFLRPVSEAK